MNVLIFDTETTSADDPKLIEAAGIFLGMGGHIDLRPTAQFCERFNPGVPSSLGALATHHILDSELVGLPAPETFAVSLDAEDYLIGHNIDFDWKVIGSPDVKRICTLALARWALPSLDSHKLGALAYHFLGDEARELVRQAHGALADCEMVRHVLRWLLPSIKAHGFPMTWEGLWHASEVARVPTVMAFGKHKGAKIADLPRDYVDWLLRQSDIDPYLRRALLGG